MLLEEEFIKPMLRSGDYTNKVIMRQLDISYGKQVADFSGNMTSPASLANRHHVQVTPTILFLDANGRELVSRMIGINTIEFYGGYLDSAIDEALHIMRHRHLATR
jgi:thioredoxin-related protein